MKKIITLIFSICVWCQILNSQCEEGRYRDLIFEEAELQSDILYGNNLDLNEVSQDLFLDIYTPANDTETMRPLVVFAHGGVFVSGSKEGTDVVPLCNDFARMGYTVASIQYRLGLPLTTQLELPATEAVLRGVHDMRAAIRFFRKSVQEDGNPYNIDPDKVYIAGVSAGGFIALHLAYMDELEEIPEIVDQTVPGLTGGIEGESGNEGYSSEVSGIVNICGALGNTTWMKPADEPVLSFHGTEDGIVPFGSEVLTLLSLPVSNVDGSESIHLKAQELNLTHCFEIHEGQGHVPHTNNEQYYDTTRAIMSNFLSHLVCPDIELNCNYREQVDVGINEVGLNRTFLVFPNPASENMFLIVPESRRSSEITAIDSYGREIFVQSVDPFSDRTEFNASSLEAGYYLIRWSDGELTRTSRLLIR